MSASAPKRFDLIVFDWDGTLADSTAVIVHAIQQAFAELGLPVPGRRAASFVIGFRLDMAMRHLAPQADDALIDAVVERYKQAYLARDGEIALFDGVAASLARLQEQGHALAVATGKSRRGLDRALESSGLRRYFDVTRSADECHSKPHPQMLEEITDYLGMDMGSSLMVGDTTHDLQMALNAGMAGVGVCYGAHPREELAALSPLALFEQFEQFDQWLRIDD